MTADSAVTDRSRDLALSSCPPARGRGSGGRTFKVSAEGATRGDGTACPVARACREMWPGCEPHIEGTRPYVVLADGRRAAVLLSTDLIEEIGKFDRNEDGSFRELTIEIIKEEGI